MIPPYTFEDEDGETQTFPGLNWGARGQAIWQNGCSEDPLTPIVECVESTGGGLLAHFGYDNPNASSVEPPASENLHARPCEPRPAREVRAGPPRRCLPGRVLRGQLDLVADREQRDRLRRLEALPGLDHGRQTARPDRRRRPLYPRDRRRGRRKRSGRRRRRHDRHDRRRCRRTYGERVRVGAHPPRRLHDLDRLSHRRRDRRRRCLPASDRWR